MAGIAAYSDIGRRNQANEDACCVEFANTPLGEVALAVMCDGVGGYAAGEIASATVVHHFSNWFEHELPLMLSGMVSSNHFAFDTIQAIWTSMLHELNGSIRSFGVSQGYKLGTTFTGLITCNGEYLIGHVGDCRALLLSESVTQQLTVDQTLENMQKLGAAVDVTSANAHVIMQAVGTQRALKPVFYKGAYKDKDLFILCCDGVWKRLGNDKVAEAFSADKRQSNESLEQACKTVVNTSLELGELDNLSIVSLVASAKRPISPPRTPSTHDELVSGDDSQIMVFGDGGDDTETVVFDDAGDDTATTVFADSFESDAPTKVLDDSAGNDMPTVVFEVGDA